MCLADSRVTRVNVQVEKLDVLSDEAVVGVEIERSCAD
jgi:dihydroneopterin aldolase